MKRNYTNARRFLSAFFRSRRWWNWQASTFSQLGPFMKSSLLEWVDKADEKKEFPERSFWLFRFLLRIAELVKIFKKHEFCGGSVNPNSLRSFSFFLALFSFFVCGVCIYVGLEKLNLIPNSARSAQVKSFLGMQLRQLAEFLNRLFVATLEEFGLWLRWRGIFI